MSKKTNNTHLQFLASRWLNGSITQEQKAKFDKWYNGFDDTQLLQEDGEDVNELKQRMYQRVLDREGIKVNNPRYASLMVKFAAAATLLIFVGLAGWFLLHSSQPELQIGKKVNDAVPGGNYAVLKLADGRQIDLGVAGKGKLAAEKNVEISKTGDGKIQYHETGDLTEGIIAYNEINTKRGGLYTVTLEDGSTVMLNSASSLRYPAKFSTKERRVELEGEAYFEVAKDKSHPFIVVTKQQTVKVLGTHFNINSYADEPIVKTTLLEGSVKVTDVTSFDQRILKPGEESVLTGHRLSTKQADIEQTMAWTNGDFIFKSENLESIMRKISRWYNVDIEYASTAPRSLTLDAEITKSKNLSAILKILENTGKVKFKLENGRLTVM